MYNKIKKEHLFIFLVLFTAIVLLNYFEYTGLTTTETCTDTGYQCCEQGEGVNYFSLDYSCSNNKQCWTSCTKETNQITGSVTWESVWSPIENFFKNLFGRGTVGGTHQAETCPENEPNLILSYEDGHASLDDDNSYSNLVCDNNLKRGGGRNILGLSGRTNAHVSNDGSYGERRLNIGADQGVAICGYSTDQDSICNPQNCLFSISGNTNAHIGNCNQFDIKVCCEVPPPNIICERNERTCEDNSVKICNNQGTRYLPLQPCEDNEKCEGGECILLSIECEEGDKKCGRRGECEGGICVMECNNEETWEIKEICTGNTPLCNRRTKTCVGRNEDTFTLTVLIEPLESGTVDIKEGTYEKDEMVTITADPEYGFKFNEWTGDIDEDDIINIIDEEEENKIIVKMNKIKIITANFQSLGARGGSRKAGDKTSCEELNQQQRVTCATTEKGECKAGTQIRTCKLKEGEKKWTRIEPCVSIKAPTTENCNNQLDDDCDGFIDKQDPNCINLNQNCEDESGRGVTYETCSRDKEYCGYKDSENNGNLIRNNGFELEFNNWLKYKDGIEDVEYRSDSNIKNEGTKSYYINVPRNTQSEPYYASIKQTINVIPNNFYRLSVYARTTAQTGREPFLSVKCKDRNGRDIWIDIDNTKIDPYEYEDVTSPTIKGNRFDQYHYTFKTSPNAVSCEIKPVEFSKGMYGKAWIDSIRVERIGETPELLEDCGICGCSTDKPYCQANGICSDEAPDVDEICDNGIDDDHDNIIDEFDYDCYDENSKFVSLKKEGLRVSNNNPYTYSKIMADCSYNIFDSEGDIPTKTNDLIENSLDCIKLQGTECEEKIATAGINGIYNVKFLDCDVGSQEGEKTISCIVNEKCNGWEELPDGADPEEYTISLQGTIDVQNYNYCPEGSQTMDLVSTIETNKEDYESGDTIEITISVQNFIGDERIITEAALVDLNTGEIIKEESSEERLVKWEIPIEPEEFEINLIIPQFSTNSYRLYTKAYVVREENQKCSQASKELEIEVEGDEGGIELETNCTNGIDDDEDHNIDCNDNDCYYDEACIIQETCNEENEGEFMFCNTGLEGICQEGTQTCAFREWGECIQSREEELKETCDNQLDDNCDGRVDEGCTTTSLRDSDGDGLLDEWEMQYFGNLYQGPNDDYDNDGVSNLNEFIDDTDPSNKSDKIKEGSLLWLWILLGIILVGAIIFFGLKLLNKPGGSSSFTDPRLKDYVQGSLRKGFTKQQIKQALTTKGWSQGDIDKTLK